MTTTRTSRLLGTGAAAALAATVVNAAIYEVGRAADVAYLVDGEPIELQHVVSLSLMSFGVGLVAAAVVHRVRPQGLRVLAAVGAALGVLTMAMDLSVDSAAAGVTLAAMHLVVGVAYLLALRTGSAVETDAIAANRDLVAA
jgi:hypothetical protein